VERRKMKNSNKKFLFSFWIYFQFFRGTLCWVLWNFLQSLRKNYAQWRNVAFMGREWRTIVFSTTKNFKIVNSTSEFFLKTFSLPEHPFHSNNYRYIFRVTQSHIESTRMTLFQFFRLWRSGLMWTEIIKKTGIFSD